MSCQNVIWTNTIARSGEVGSNLKLKISVVACRENDHLLLEKMLGFRERRFLRQHISVITKDHLLPRAV